MTWARAVRTAACLVTVAFILTWTGTAAVAHDHSLPDADRYRSTVTTVEPAIPGLIPTISGDDDLLTLTNHTGETVLVIGYAYEDYLRISPAGVDENIASLTSWMNRSLATEGQSPPDPEPEPPNQQQPDWRHVSDQPTFTWHDHRTHWMADQPPPTVEADPTHPHKIFDWAVPLTVDGEKASSRKAMCGPCVYASACSDRAEADAREPVCTRTSLKS